MTGPLRPGNSLPHRYYQPRPIGRIGRGFLITTFTLGLTLLTGLITGLVIGAVT